MRVLRSTIAVSTGHLLEDIEVWEVAEEGIVNIVRKKQINDSEMS